jgi:hypothetical protein
MKILFGVMSNISKKEYLESCRQRYLSRNRAGRSAMIDEIIDAFGWDRKHAIKALKGKVTHGTKAQKRGSKSTPGTTERDTPTAAHPASRPLQTAALQTQKA